MKTINFFYKSFIFIFFSAIIIGLAFYINAYFEKPIVLNNVSSIEIYDANENLIYNGKQNTNWTNINNINKNLINSVISIEDKNFYKHNGFDYLRIIKALFNNFKNKSIIEGASTISQQYIKNAYLSFDKTWSRKYKEAIMTLNLEMHYSKEEILEAYLNSINYSNGNYGITEASKYYFNKTPSELTLEESILLSGIPKNPQKYNPLSNYDECKKRAKVVALSMLNNNYISKDKYNNLNFDKLEIGNYKNEDQLDTLMYYIDATLNELDDINNIQKENIKIYTSFNYNVQKTLEEEINQNLDKDLQVSSIITNPKDGSIISLIGGRNYKESQYNRAIKSKRQVGSTMKPFLYYAALESGMTSTSTFLSQYTTFNIDNNKTYSPKNYGNIYGNKEITMGAAISYSDNIYAVKTNLYLGTDKLIEVAKKCGINENLKKVPSLALGTSEMSLWNFTNGYNTLASGGYKNTIHIINEIKTNEGISLYKYKKNNNLVLNPNYVYILNELLTSTTNANYIDYNTPTALNIASMLSQKYAIKTGTTNTDYLTVGYSPEKLMVMWTGYDDNSEIDISVGTKSKIIFANTIESIKDNDIWYTKPDNVIGKIRDSITGKEINDTSTSTIYYYLKGSEPK